MSSFQSRLDRHWRNVLAPSTDDELFVAPSDLKPNGTLRRVAVRKAQNVQHRVGVNMRTGMRTGSSAHVGLVARRLVTRVQPTIRVNRLLRKATSQILFKEYTAENGRRLKSATNLVLLQHLCRVLLAQTRVAEIAHHDVTAPEMSQIHGVQQLGVYGSEICA
jgi:hypothetical protein